MKYIFFVVLIFSICNSSAQTETRPERLKEYLKKQGGKFGIWNFKNNQWEINPEYDKVTGTLFNDKPYSGENHTFYKLYKGNTFDLMKRQTDKKDVWLTLHTIVVKGISAFSVPFDKTYSPNTDYLDCNYVYYKKDGRWGWAAGELESGTYQPFENIVVPPASDNPPVLLQPFLSDVPGIVWSKYQNPVLIIDSAGKLGLLKFSGERITDPLYTKFEIKKFNYKTYYICYLPDGTTDLRLGSKLLSAAERAELDNSEKLKVEADKAQAIKEEETRIKLKQWLEGLRFTLKDKGIGMRDGNDSIILPEVASAIEWHALGDVLKVYMNQDGDSIIAEKEHYFMDPQTYIRSSNDIYLHDMVGVTNNKPGSFVARVYCLYYNPVYKSNKVYTVPVEISYLSHPTTYRLRELSIATMCPVCTNKDYIVIGKGVDTVTYTTKSVVKDGKTKIRNYNLEGFSVDEHGVVRNYTVTDERTIDTYKLKEEEIKKAHEYDKTTDCPLVEISTYLDMGERKTSKRHTLELKWDDGENFYLLRKKSGN